MLWILRRRTKFAGWIPLFPQMKRILLCRVAAALLNLCLASTWKISVWNLLTKQSRSSYCKAYKQVRQWSSNLTNMPNKCGYLMTTFLARQLLSRQGKSSTLLTPSPHKVQRQIPSTVQRDRKWMNCTHTRQEQSVPSGVRSSSEAEACPSRAATPWTPRTDSWDKRVQKGSPSHKELAVLSWHFLRLVSWYHSRARNPCSGRLFFTSQAFPDLGLEASTLLDLNNAPHSSSRYVHLKANKRETGCCSEINTLHFANYWEFDNYQ